MPQLPERKSPCGDLRIRVGLIGFPRPQRKLVIPNGTRSQPEVA
jgi:hypothetical protein